MLFRTDYKASIEVKSFFLSIARGKFFKIFSDLASPTTTPHTTARTSTTDLEQPLNMEVVIPNSCPSNNEIPAYPKPTKNQTNQSIQTYCKIIFDMIEY